MGPGTISEREIFMERSWERSTLILYGIRGHAKVLQSHVEPFHGMDMDSMWNPHNNSTWNPYGRC